jgi:hypothetical protein
MLAPLLLCLSTLTASPQGPGGPVMPEHRKPRLAYPIDPQTERTIPFRDGAQAPQPVAIAAAGLADLDGDGCDDAWFLGDGARAGTVSVQRARTWSLSRYSPWPWPQGGDLHHGPWSAATTYRSGAFTRDRILLADPGRADLDFLHYGYPPNADPRSGAWYAAPSGYSLSGTGTVSLATHDAAGDGHDDVVALRTTDADGYVVELLRFGTPNGHLQIASRATFALPIRIERIRAADIDGDGRTDVVLVLPGVGVGWLRDDGVNLVPAGLVPTGAAVVHDIAIGDVDGDGCDDFAIVADTGTLVVRAFGSWMHWLPRLAGQASLAAAAIFDTDGDGLAEVAAFARDGRSFALHPWIGGTSGFGPAWLRVPPASSTTSFQGNGTTGVLALIADHDRDGDDDVLLAMPSGDAFVPLRNPARSFAPPAAVVVHEGAVGETGYLRVRMTIYLPEAARLAGITDVEIVVMLRLRNAPEYVYWGRLIRTANPTTGEVTIPVYMLANHQLQPQMIAGNRPYLFTDGITAGGETLLSFHAKSGPRRGESLFVHHDPGGDGNKSGLGVNWDLRAAPPVPGARDEVLPWD